MGALFNSICIALLVTFSAVFVSSQSAGSNSSVTSNTTTTNAVAPSGERTQCYECSTFDESQDCDGPSSNTPIVTCEVDEKMCRKVEQHITINGKDHIRTFRQCAKTGDLGKCDERTGTFGFKSWYCQCKGSLCNGAGNAFVSFTLLGSMLISFFFLKNRL